MPIKVQCAACGSAFAAKDELAGRTVACPNCKKPLAIPAAATVAAAPQQRSAAPRQVSAPLPSQAAPAAGDAHALFDEVGLKAQQAGTVLCPGCAQPMPMNAVVCIKCGFNKKIGRRMETSKITEAAPLPGGHNVTADELLTKAAQRIQDEKDEERKKTREGMPWWVYLIGMIGCIGFIVMMMVLPQKTALMTGGIIVWALASLINLYAIVRLTMFAFSQSMLDGVLFIVSLFICGLYNLYYVIRHWDSCGGYFIMAFLSNLVAFMVQVALQYTLSQEEKPQGFIPEPRPAIVRVVHTHELVHCRDPGRNRLAAFQA